jgi:hypothetical protein
VIKKRKGKVKGGGKIRENRVKKEGRKVGRYNKP